MAQELLKYRDLIQGGDDEDLLKAFARIQLERDVFIARGAQRREEQAAATEPGISMTDLLIGDWAGRRAREMMKGLEQESRRKDKRNGDHGRKR
jgi:hypothetical protein